MAKRRQPADAPLPASFYLRDTDSVARDLLGTVLVKRDEGTERRLVIVETEAYLGTADRAAHTWNGRRTPRVRPMWGPGGHAYVYRVYGIHSCLNVVTREEGIPEAVLIRAAVPERWWEGAAAPGPDLLAASGPGKLCSFLGITSELSGSSLLGPALEIRRGTGRPFGVLVGPRVGVDYAGEAAGWPLRFGVEGCPAVTSRRSLRPLRASGRRAGPRSPGRG